MLPKQHNVGRFALCALPGGRLAPVVAAERYQFRVAGDEQGLSLGTVAHRAARILVADDDPAVRRFLKKLLEGVGYGVIEASDGKQVLSQVRAEHVVLVITDLVMPEQEGIETIQTLRRDFPGIGIIAISGAFEGQCLKAAQMLGADAALNKPVNIDLLLAKVTEVLQSRHACSPRPA